ncbi:MAG: putative metal-binding motif-containing protein [Myxococcota bacterium]
MHRTVIASLCLCGLLGPGCTFISRDLYESRRDELDQDGDGVVYADDCDDDDPSVYPGALEIPYDGVDSDCNGQDLIDADGDGFPGITAEAYAALGSDVPYPEPLVGKPLDCADDPAEIPTAASIHPDPTHAIETYYDAIDGDCQGDNDFDFDGDGFMPDVVVLEGVTRPTAEVFQEYVQAWHADVDSMVAPPGHPAPVVGDCDDLDIDVHPENTIPDVFYDGVDRDCDHRNDYDQDGDCFMPPEAAAGYAAYVKRTYGNQPVPFCVDPDRPFEDCLDAPDPSIRTVPDGGPVDPATVHPDTATYPLLDEAYDGVDADCGADNDFDGDHDGFMPDDLPYDPSPDTLDDLVQAYAATWGYEDLAADWTVTGDCDDARADTYPGALEVLGDGLDQDCAGTPDTAAWGFGDGTTDFDWTRPTNPEVARIGDTLLVLVGAETGQIPGQQTEFGVALPFAAATARNGSAPQPSPPYWKTTSDNLHMQQVLDVAVRDNPVDEDGDGVPDPSLTVAYSTDNVVTGFTHLTVNSLRLQSTTGLLSPVGGTSDFVSDAYATTGLDVRLDPSGNVFALACADGWLHMTFSITPPPVRGTVQGDPADTCFFHDLVDTGPPEQAPLTVCAGGACEAYVATDEPALDGPAAVGGSWVFGDADGDWISLIDDAGEATVREIGGADERVFVGETVRYLDVAYDPPNLYVAGVVDGVGGPEVKLAYGPPGALVEQDLAFDDPSVVGEVPAAVAVYADADRVAVAVTALTGRTLEDSVGWVFLGPP